MYKPFICLLFSFFIFACNVKTNVSNESSASSTKTNVDKQLNISILLDLSDRVDTTEHPANPQHYVRDINVVKSIAEFFVTDMKRRGTFNSKGKIQVIFSPAPNDPNIDIFAQKLNVDCSSMTNPQKKNIYDNLSAIFSDNISKIYKQALADNQWPGCDIWSFFKNDVDMCMEKDGYRNILVLITDGYIYHADTKIQENNKYSWILPELLKTYNLRGNPQWEAQLNKTKFGLIAERNDLANLEVLVLEVTPSSNQYKMDEDILKGIITNWLTEMGVIRKAIFFSDLPVYTKRRITDFFTK